LFTFDDFELAAEEKADTVLILPKFLCRFHS